MDQQTHVSITDAEGITIATVEVPEISPSVTEALLAWRNESGNTDQPVKLVMDLSKVKFIDSVALGALVVLLRRIRQNGGRLALAGLTGHAMRVLQVTNLEKVFELFDDVSSAIDGLRHQT